MSEQEGLKKATKQLYALSREVKWEQSKRGRFVRWLIFKFGFSQCRHCIYCEGDGDKYRGLRESIHFGSVKNAKCHWSSESSSSNLTYSDTKKIHRCPAFLPMLYNFMDYAIDSQKVIEISKIKSQNYSNIIGWIVIMFAAVLTAVLSR